MALATGRPPRALLREWTSIDLAELQAFVELEGLEPDRQDLRVGLLASLLHGSRAGKAAMPTEFLARDFLPLLAAHRTERTTVTTASRQRAAANTLRMALRGAAVAAKKRKGR